MGLVSLNEAAWRIVRRGDDTSIHDYEEYHKKYRDLLLAANEAAKAAGIREDWHTEEDVDDAVLELPEILALRHVFEERQQDEAKRLALFDGALSSTLRIFTSRSTRCP